MPPNLVLQSAVDAVVSSFKSHSNQDQVDAVEALREFWQLKEAKGLHFLNGCSILYEFTTKPTVCFVTLPGGSCFASFEFCDSVENAKQSAAKIALTNSVLNEHACNIINSSTIEQMVSVASLTFASQLKDGDTPLALFRKMLENHAGKSFLSFQEKMSAFQLLHWNGSLKAMKESGCSRNEILQHYLHRGIDDAMKSKMAVEWIEREGKQPGIIARELHQVEDQLEVARFAGRELRFQREKSNILREATNQLSFH